jgi:hypothetical protein
MRVIEGLTERSPNFDELHVLLNDSSMREHEHTPSCASQVHSIRVLLTVKRHVFIACPICGPELTKLQLFKWASEGDFARSSECRVSQDHDLPSQCGIVPHKSA